MCGIWCQWNIRIITIFTTFIIIFSLLNNFHLAHIWYSKLLRRWNIVYLFTDLRYLCLLLWFCIYHFIIYLFFLFLCWIFKKLNIILIITIHLLFCHIITFIWCLWNYCIFKNWRDLFFGIIEVRAIIMG